MRYDATLASWLYAMEMLIRQVTWTAVPASEDARDIELAEFLDEQANGMKDTWENFIRDALTLIPFGYAFHEVVYQPLDNGRVGWYSMVLQPPIQFYEWQCADNGDIEALVETTPGGGRVVIPIEKAVLFEANSKR